MISLTIRNRTGLVYNAEAKSVSSFNAHGRFDVLENHISYLTTIEKEVIVVDASGKEKNIPLEHGGFIMAHMNNVHIVVGT